MVWHPNRPILH